MRAILGRNNVRVGAVPAIEKAAGAEAPAARIHVVRRECR